MIDVKHLYPLFEAPPEFNIGIMPKASAKGYIAWYLGDCDRRIRFLCSVVGAKVPENVDEQFDAVQKCLEWLDANAYEVPIPKEWFKPATSERMAELQSYRKQTTIALDIMSFCFDFSCLLTKFYFNLFPDAKVDVEIDLNKQFGYSDLFISRTTRITKPLLETKALASRVSDCRDLKYEFRTGMKHSFKRENLPYHYLFPAAEKAVRKPGQRFYPDFDIPMPWNNEEIDRKNGAAFFDWYLANQDARIARLVTALGLPFPQTPKARWDALLAAGEWLRKYGEVEPFVEADSTRQVDAYISGRTKGPNPTPDLWPTLETKSFCFDMGILLAKCYEDFVPDLK